MKLRQARKIIADCESMRHRDGTLGKALQRERKTRTHRETERYWEEEIKPLLRARRQLTEEEAEQAWIDAPSIPMRCEDVARIVEFVTGKPIEVTRLKQEQTPDGPLTTRERGTL